MPERHPEVIRLGREPLPEGIVDEIKTERLPHHTSISRPPQPHQRFPLASRERKALAAKSQNTLHRLPPPPSPNMSVVETAAGIPTLGGELVFVVELGRALDFEKM
ncbi:hypothetical protein CONLIGDRAFT_687649 [Coniochaeta ligniaria NRRL 30616]|uniref:Uncharacterized protein n=1 Tax=Coniochaeta ligniaria NRRL 30616 TaxID=1408157 RepID=A0A1J7I3Z2_9PEZI|nr:hypothetical protein CONLIGDRAFT_687649 [Coniochaeta ligniaria NRRL 30616]